MAKEQVPVITTNGPKRRSTRIVHAVPLVITWLETPQKTRIEETVTLSLNCHGCRYFSRFKMRKGAKITAQIGADKGNSTSEQQNVRARVAWIQKSRRLPGLYQVGIEFETPQDVWTIEDAPEDWNRFSPGTRQDTTAIFLIELERMLQFAQSGTYYELLGVQSDAPHAEIKRQFYRFARRFHPDHHMDHPEWTPRLLVLMDSLATAYKALSDDREKQQYDSSLETSGARRSDEGESEPQRVAQDCLEKARECLAAKNYVGSILWLRRAIEVEPHSSEFRVMLGRSLAAVPEYRREAAEQFAKAIELDPRNLKAHFYYAQMLEQMKLPLRARPLYMRVLELDAGHREARERLNQLNAGNLRSSTRPSLLGRLTGRR